MVGAGDDGIVVQRREGFAVPWDELLAIEPPLQALEDGRSWEGTFRVRAWECTAVAVGGFECSSSRHAGPATWVIRPEIVEGPPTRIDLYDNGTGELISSIVPPDDGRPIDDVLFELGAENSVGSRTELFVVDRDGTNVRPIDWAFGEAGFAELAGRRFVLAGGDGDELLLWVTDDGETWEQLALPAGIDQDGY